MDKKKSKWTILKEAWKDPKKHAIICLILYAIFFIGIFVSIKITELTSSLKNENVEEEETYVNEKTRYRDMDNYEYNYNITLNGSVYEIEGTVYLEKEKFTLKNTKESFYIEQNDNEFDDKYINLENTLNLNLEKIKPYSIYGIIKNLTPNESTEYSDSTKKEIYNLKLENIKDILKNTYKDYNQEVIITIYSDNSKINRIEIDIDCMELKEFITIEYTNIGNIKDFTISN